MAIINFIVIEGGAGNFIENLIFKFFIKNPIKKNPKIHKNPQKK
jgi:hypothetical protein